MNIHTARSNRSMSRASEYLYLSNGYLYYDNDKWSYYNNSIPPMGYTIDLTQLYIDIQSWIVNQVELYKLNGGEISIYSINPEYIILLWSNRFISIKLKLARPNFIPLFIVNSNNQSYYTHVANEGQYEAYYPSDYQSVVIFHIQKYTKIYSTSISNSITNEYIKSVNVHNECRFSYHFTPGNLTLFKFELLDRDQNYENMKNTDIHNGYHIFDYRPEDIANMEVSFDDNVSNFQSKITEMFKYIDNGTYYRTIFIDNLRSSILQQYNDDFSL